jgi:hypothetical protein
MTISLTTAGATTSRPRVYSLPTVREVPLPPPDGGATDTW